MLPRVLHSVPAAPPPPAGAWSLFPSLCGDSGTVVPAIDPPSDASFRAHYYEPQRPVILRGLCAPWRASTAWSFTELKRRLGETPVPAFPTKAGMIDYAAETGTVSLRKRFSELLDTIQTADRPPWFLMLYPAVDVPELLPDVEFPEYCSRALWKNARITIAGRSASTPLHREISDNFFCLFSGRKEFALFPPGETRDLYGLGLRSGAPHISRVAPEAPDLSDFPRAAKLTPWRCQVNAGDVLYVPRRWWHAVATHEPAVGMGCWWAEGLHAALPLAAQAYKKIRAIET
jgi:hypothetical protein